MDKRGVEHQLFFAFEAILGILVAGVLISTAINFDSVSSVNKIYAQDDLNLLLFTLQSAPGDVEYNYTLKSLYEVSIQENKVTVLQNNDLLSGYSYYTLILEKDSETEHIEVKKSE